MNMESSMPTRIRKRCGVLNQRNSNPHYQQQHQQQQQCDRYVDSRHIDCFGSNAPPPPPPPPPPPLPPSNVYEDNNDNYDFYQLSTPPPPQQYPQQLHQSQHCFGAYNTSSPHDVMLFTTSTYYKKKHSSFSPPSSLSSPLIPKSIVTAYTPATTATTASTATASSYTPLRNVTPTKLPLPPRLEPLPEHWNHDDDHYYDRNRNQDTEPAIQFVERTTYEMHEIVQYWLSLDTPPLSASTHDTFDSKDTSLRDVNTENIPSPQQPSPLPNNTLWNLRQDDDSEADHDVGDENDNDDNNYYFYKSIQCQVSRNHYGEAMNDDNMDNKNNDYDTSVEEFFLRLEECQCQTEHCYNDCEEEDPQQQQQLHYFSKILYPSCSSEIPPPPQNCTVDSHCIQRISLSPLVQKRQKQQQLYHPFIILHSKTKTATTSNISTTKSIWQWIHEQWYHNDLLRQQQFRRRVWNVLFILVSGLTLLLVGSLLLVSIHSSSMIIDWYHKYFVVPNIDDGMEMTKMSTHSCLAE